MSTIMFARVKPNDGKDQMSDGIEKDKKETFNLKTC